MFKKRYHKNRKNNDMELVAVFTRRDPAMVSILTESAKVCNIAEVEEWKDKIDAWINKIGYIVTI